MKKGDLIIIILVFLVTAILFTVFFLIKSDGKTVVIKENNEITAEYPLDTDRVIELTHNTVNIQNSEVFMKSADCKNQICVKTGKISKGGECIVCLPNKVIVEIK